MGLPYGVFYPLLSYSILNIIDWMLATGQCRPTQASEKRHTTSFRVLSTRERLISLFTEAVHRVLIGSPANQKQLYGMVTSCC